MRTYLTALVIAFAFINVAASVRGQVVTLDVRNSKLESVFAEIKKQTGYQFWYEDNVLKNIGTVSVSVSGAKVEEAIRAALKGKPLDYSINETTVVIKRKSPTILDRLIGAIKAIDVYGQVLNENNQPLVGATIRLKGTTKQAQSDRNGKFYLENIEENATLEITYLGYTTAEIKASPTITIKLTPSSEVLQEVNINAGYYTVSDKERTGSISKVGSQTIGQQPVNNSLIAIQGRIPGVQITQSSGIAGSGINVQIRGQNSIRNGNDPLYIVDGVTFPSRAFASSGVIGTPLGSDGPSALSLINPNDIQSIEILKDADATAIYGSRGANGVVLITTKKGGMGGTKVNANISQGYAQVGHRLDLLNTEQYISMRKEAIANDGLQITATDLDINGTWDPNSYTDWQEELIGHSAGITNASLNIGGGGTKNNYLIAGNYYREGTVFPGSQGLDRFTLRSNIGLGSEQDRFRASFTATFNRTNTNISSTALSSYVLLPPNFPYPFDQNGQLNFANGVGSLNPMAELLNTSKAETDNLIANLTLSYRIGTGLELKLSGGYSAIRRKEIQRYPVAAINPANAPTSANRVAYFGNNQLDNIIAEPMLTFQRPIGKGKIDALLGMSFQNNITDRSAIRAADFSSDALMSNIGSAGNLSPYAVTYSQYRYAALFSRINYALKSRYFFNLTARRDGSSRFGPGKQFANFGAIGAAWIFSEESFIKTMLPFVSFGKLRASYGITGNDQIGDYQYLQLWNTNATYQGAATTTPEGTAPNADFAWESNRKVEGALQLGFLNDRLNIEVAHYRNRSSNQLLLQTLPSSTGYTSVTMNLPGVVQNTGWEFDSSLQLINGKNLRWKTSFNLTIPKNKLLAYPGLLPTDIVYEVGQPLSILKTYHATVDSQSGLYSIEDSNGNGSIENQDRYVLRFLGQKYYGGLENSLRLGGFDLTIFLSFAKQNGRSYHSAPAAQIPGRWAIGFQTNQPTEVLDRWQQAGDMTSTQRFTTLNTARTQFNSNIKNSDLTVVDASYIRLKNIALAYRLPAGLLAKLKISNASINLQGQNLYTFTKYMGYDPETGVYTLPPLRTLTLGLNINL